MPCFDQRTDLELGPVAIRLVDSTKGLRQPLHRGRRDVHDDAVFKPQFILRKLGIFVIFVFGIFVMQVFVFHCLAFLAMKFVSFQRT